MFVGGLLAGIFNILGGFASQIYLTASMDLGSRSRAAANPFAAFSDPIYLGIRGGSSLISFPVQAFMMGGMMLLALRVAKGEPYRFGDIFGGAPFFLSVLLTQLLTAIAVGIGCVFLIVPGVILGLGLMMTMPAIVDRKLGPIEAMQESWRITTGHKGALFLFLLLALVLMIAGLCACGVGMFVAAPIVQIAMAFIYLRLTGQQTAPVQS